MYEFIVLAQLMHGPAHGYLIAKIINDMIGPYARISYGRLYPLLAKMEESGLIEAVNSGKAGQKRDRNLHVFKITGDGRMRFRLLMNDTGSNPGDYAELFAHKVSAFAFVTPTERLRLIDHYINYCQAHVFHMQTEAVDLVRIVAETDEMFRDSPHLAQAFPRMDTNSLEYTVNTMQHTIDHWQLEMEWARNLRAKEIVLVENTAQTSTPARVIEMPASSDQ